MEYEYWIQMAKRGTHEVIEKTVSSIGEQFEYIGKMRQEGYYLMDTAILKK